MKLNNPVNLAIIGTGAWSGCIGNVMNKSKKVNLVTCYDPNKKKRIAFSEKFHCEQEDSYLDVLKQTDIDGVHLATPNASHAEQTILAAQYGKHVFVEKPIANTIADAEKMITACQDAKVTLMVGQHMRRLSGIRKLKELIDDGTIGLPIQVESNYSQNLGFAISPESFRWKGDNSGCPGGSLMTLGIHSADVFNYLLGPIYSAFAFFNKLYIPAPVDDVTTAIFKYESGVLGYLGSNYASPKAVWFYIYGTEANLLFTVTPPELPFEEYLLWWEGVDQDSSLKIFKKGQTGSESLPFEYGNPILEEVEEFADCIQTGARPETDGEGALSALRLINAAIESAGSGKEVLLN
jgi:predicted dehydrogenase